MDGVKMEPLLLHKWLLKSLVWLNFSLLFWCNWLWKVLKLCNRLHVKLARCQACCS